ncbi:ankyrin repeat-containing domain protein [Aspergillus cavernicola]|uniref:Ankyrin repeat-containing domain protein n=1 Tax=Aspergillus cavernicola TaxID=176166 RepID=A0ABR4J1F1_9EURO
MNELLHKTTCMELSDTLETLSKVLPGIYVRILSRIDERQRQKCALVLLWATLAVRPLTIHQLADVIALQTSTVLNRKQTMLGQLVLYRSFIRVQDGEIGLIHQSVRDYLLRDHPDQNPILDMFRIRPEEGHCKIVLSCLDFLERGDALYDTWSQKLQILDYAIHHWPHNAQHVGNNADIIFDISRPIFQNDSEVVFNWFNHHVNPGFVLREIREVSTLHIASIYGLTPWIRKLLAQKKLKFNLHRYLNRKDSQGYTPLLRSTAGGHEAATQLLLENCADVNVQQMFGKGPQELAAPGGVLPVLRLLLQHGANINALGSQAYTLLTEVCSLKDLEMAQWLIAHGAIVNPTSKRMEPPLKSAAYTGSDDIVELLIKHGADVNVKNKRGISALSASMANKSSGTAQILLSHSADPNCIDKYGFTNFRGH